MGWTYQHKGRSGGIKEFFQTEFNWCGDGVKDTVLDCAVVGMKTAYLAIERIRDTGRDVVAVVCLLDYRPADYHNFGYKEIGESSHPYYYDCPKRILALLTDTDNTNSLEWRETCRKRLADKAKQPSMKSGYWLILNSPVAFGNGESRSVFYIQNAKNRDFRAQPYGGQRYGLNKRALDNNIKAVMRDDEYLAALKV